jgi:predicted SnoaL-like aldol condensation-catalyzing enzyme
MKKSHVFNLVLGLSLSFSFAACGGDDKETLSNADKAQAVLKALETLDPKPIESYISAEKYIQHNLAFPDGRAVLLGAINDGKLAGTKVDVKRIFSDGDYVVAHVAYTLFGQEQVGIDIFRFENGLIVEHWDNLQVDPKVPNQSGRTMVDGPTEVVDQDKTAANKTLVSDFVQKVMIQGDTTDAASFFAADYKQHNPQLGDGAAALLGLLQKLGHGLFTKSHYTFGEGNFVLTVAEGPDAQDPSKTAAYFDLFRVENGKLAEHWDVISVIPPQTEWANANGKF